MDVRFERGAVIAGEGTLTVHGRIVALAHEVFDLGSGRRVRMVGRGTPEVVPQWWGAKANNTAGDGAALAALADAIRGDGPSVVVFAPGIYALEQTVSLPAGKRYVATGAAGAVVLTRHAELAGDAPLCICHSLSVDVSSRVSFKGLFFDGGGGNGSLLRVVSGSPRNLLETTVTDCGFMASGAAAIEAQRGASIFLDRCSFVDCAVAFQNKPGVRSLVSISRTRATGQGGDVLQEGGDRSVVTIAECDFGGRLKLVDCRDGDVRVIDSTFDGLDVDAPESRIGLVNSRLGGTAVVDGTVVVAEARQVVLQGCEVGLTPRSRQAVAVRIRWRSGAEGAVLMDDCSLDQSATMGAGQGAIEIADAGGEGVRRVDVMRSRVGAVFAWGARLIGARASFHAVELQSVGAFRLQASIHGTGPALTVVSSRYMPIKASRPGPYLSLAAVPAAVTPFVIRHEDVTLDPEFNLIEASSATLVNLELVGARHIRGPVQLLDARPEGVSGLIGDIFSPRNLLQNPQGPAWPTEWWCVQSGVGGEAVWQPVCTRPVSPFIPP